MGACQSLILAPTRELAQQIYKVVLALGDYLKVKCHACIGGTSVRDDIDRLRDGQHVVVGTPGRVYDMVSKRHLRIDDLLAFVCDEADEMLSRGFKDQIYDIFKTLPPNVQVCLFSATMPPEILDMTTKFMRDAVRILVKKDELTLEVSDSFMWRLRRRSGNWTLSAISTRHSPSRRRSSTATLAARSTSLPIR